MTGWIHPYCCAVCGREVLGRDVDTHAHRHAGPVRFLPLATDTWQDPDAVVTIG